MAGGGKTRLWDRWKGVHQSVQGTMWQHLINLGSSEGRTLGSGRFQSSLAEPESPIRYQRPDILPCLRPRGVQHKEVDTVGLGGREGGCTSWKWQAFCREVNRTTGASPAARSRPALPQATVAVSWYHLLSLAYGSRNRVIRRNSLLGKRGAGIRCVLILGLRSSEGPGKLQGEKGKAVV